MESLLSIFSGKAIADVSSTDVHASGQTKDKLTDNGKSVFVAASYSNGAYATDPNRGCDQPDSARAEEEDVYVQVTILSKKVNTEDETIILSPLSESLVSSVAQYGLYILVRYV